MRPIADKPTIVHYILQWCHYSEIWQSLVCEYGSSYVIRERDYPHTKEYWERTRRKYQLSLGDPNYFRSACKLPDEEYYMVDTSKGVSNTWIGVSITTLVRSLILDNHREPWSQRFRRSTRIVGAIGIVLIRRVCSTQYIAMRLSYGMRPTSYEYEWVLSRSHPTNRLLNCLVCPIGTKVRHATQTEHESSSHALTRAIFSGIEMRQICQSLR